ncbi:MAG: hypothetical protein HYY84_00800 [Deltaproteobacteria bacterium]|nr:hypothetical protein [Deltaproteobacteria bacterium]
MYARLGKGSCTVFLAAFAGVAVSSCATQSKSENGVADCWVRLSDDFNVSLIRGLKLVIDTADGAQPLGLTPTDEWTIRKGSLSYTARVQNDDTDPNDNEFVVQFNNNVFGGSRVFLFRFEGNWGAERPFIVRATVLLEGSNQAVATATTAVDNNPITLESKVTKTVEIAVPCTPGVSCGGTIAAPVLVGTNPKSPANNNLPRIRGQAGATATIKLYASTDCSGAVVGEGTGAELATDGIGAPVLDDTTTTFSAMAFDKDGNKSPCSSTTVTYVEDSTPPAAPIVNAATNPPSPGKSLTPRVSGTTETGATIQIFKNAECEGTPAATGSAADFASGGIAVTVLNNATTTISVRAVDVAGNSSSCANPPHSYTADNASTVPALTATSPASPANSNSPRVRGSAESGAMVRLYKDSACAGGVADAGSGEPLAGAIATGTAEELAGAGVEVTVGDDSTTTFYAQATDALGNISACSSGLTFVEDSQPPATPTDLSTSPASPANTNTPSVIGTAPGAALVEISVVSCDGAVAVSGTAQAFVSPGLEIPIGTINNNTTTTIYVRAKDAAGNASGCATMSYVEDSTMPPTPTIDATNPASPANVPAGTVSVRGTAPEAVSVEIYTNSSCTTAAATGTRTEFEGVAGISVPVSRNFTTSLHAKSFDGANWSACSPVRLFTEDSSGPAVPVISMTVPGGPANNNRPKLIGSAESESTVEVFASADCSGGALADGGATEFATTGLEVWVADNSVTTLRARAIDRAGNIGPCSATSATYTEDSAPPAAPATIGTIPASPARNNRPGVYGSVEANSSVKVFRSADCSDDAGALGTAALFAEAAGGIPLYVDAGVSSISVKVIDQVGNVGPCSGAITYTYDNIAPPAPYAVSMSPTPLANNNTPAVKGTVDGGATSVRVYRSSDCSGDVAASGTSDAFQGAGLSVSVADDTTSTFSAVAVDTAGNLSPCSATLSYTEDSTSPASPVGLSVSPGATGSSNRPSIFGQAEANARVEIFGRTGCLGDAGASGSVTEFAATGIALYVDAGTTTAISARAIDVAGNLGACSTESLAYTFDNAAPTAPTGLSVSPASPANNNRPKLLGLAEANATIQVYRAASCTGAVAATGTAAAFESPGLAIYVDAGTTTFSALAIDVAGNDGGCSTSVTYTYDNVAPAVPYITTTTPPSPTNLNAPFAVRVFGVVDGGTEVYLYKSPTCDTVAASGTAAAFIDAGGIETYVSENTTTTFYVRAFDGANWSACSAAPFLFLEDSTQPTGPSGLSTSPATVANNNNPFVKGVSEPDTRIEIFSNSTCTGTSMGDGGSSEFMDAGIRVTVADNATTTFYARATDQAGNVGYCSPVGATYIEDSLVPTFAGPLAVSVDVAIDAGIAIHSLTVSWPPALDNYSPSAQIVYDLCFATTSTGCSPFVAGVTTNAGATSHTYSSLTESSRYFITAKARDESANQSAGLTANAKTKGTRATVQIETRTNHVCARQADGTVWCWGRNYYSQLGDGTPVDKSTPVLVPGLTDVVAISVGARVHSFSPYATTCALLPDGKAKCWGSNQDGQVGDGTSAWSSAPVYVTGENSLTAIATGGWHTCAVRTGGGVACWGRGTAGQLGDGLSATSYIPVTVSGLNDGVSVAVATFASCAVQSGGGASCWGSAGRLGHDAGGGSSTPVAVWAARDYTSIAAGIDHFCALRGDGTVHCWGSNAAGQLGNSDAGSGDVITPAQVRFDGGPLVGIARIAVGYNNSCAIGANGDLYCWGENDAGQIGDGTTVTRREAVLLDAGFSGVVHVATGKATYLLLGDGTLRSWGDNTYGQLGIGSVVPRLTAGSIDAGPYGVEAAKSTAAGGHTSCAVLSTGDVVCWGDNQYGQLGNGSAVASSSDSVSVSGLSRATSVVVGDDHACARLVGGTISCWGRNDRGQLGDGTTTDRNVATPISNLGDVVGITAGRKFSCVLRVGGDGACWGENDAGQLGNNTTVDQWNPVAIQGLPNAKRIVAGNRHMCALATDGGVFCWGRNSSGQVGDGTTTDRTTPVPVSGLAGIQSIAVGAQHSCALRDDGTAACWGLNWNGQLGDGTAGQSTNKSVPVSVLGIDAGQGTSISAGAVHSCVRYIDGTMSCWGANGDSALGIGDDIPNQLSRAGTLVTGLTAVSPLVPPFSTATISLVIRADGTLWGWGWGANGVLGSNSSTGDNPSPVKINLLP